MSNQSSCMGIFKFSEQYYNLFDSIIYPLISTHTGLVCHDARSYYESKTIKMDLIARMIDESHLIVIEISENNPNVFLEFAIAYNLRKPMIILCEKKKFKGTWRNQLPFDLQGRELLLYESKADLRVKLGRYVFDALFRMKPSILSWKSRHPHIHIKSNSEIRFFATDEVWSDRAIHNTFTIRYHVEISKVLQPRNPDMRLFLSYEANTGPNNVQRGYPRIIIIFPWEYSEKTQTKFECHIDYMEGANQAAERLQQVAVSERDVSKISQSNPLVYDFFVTCSWPNLIVESSLFEEEKERLVVPLDSFRDRGYPLHLPQYIGFASITCHAIISKIEIKEIIM